MRSINDLEFEKFDKKSGRVITIDIDNALIHEGNAYRISNFFPVPGSSSVFFEFVTVNKDVHFKDVSFIDGTNSFLCKLYEGPTYITGTIPITPVNANRQSLNTSSTIIKGGVTNMTGGLLIYQEYMPATNQSGGNKLGSNIEFILKKNTAYVFEIQNLDSGIGNLMAHVFWEEL